LIDAFFIMIHLSCEYYSLSGVSTKGGRRSLHQSGYARTTNTKVFQAQQASLYPDTGKAKLEMEPINPDHYLLIYR
jgi:hypothetical protein